MSAHQAPLAHSPETSQFFQRLSVLAGDSQNTDLENLATATKRLLENAAAISKQVNRFLPQFTLHDDVHLWNVLSFMEELAGGAEGIKKLGAGDCAMAIWAAFIHDLGMVLEASELAALDWADKFDTSPEIDPRASERLNDERVQAWRAYRDGHEHWSAIRQDSESPISRMRLGIIRAAFIRDSHARDDAHSGQCRIADWLKFLEEQDRLIAEALDNFSIADRVVRVAVSHNQNIGWLPRQLHDGLGATPHAEFMGAELGTIHWTWIGWLLRLADVFDCDKSRTPRILFEHGGITDARSKTEWQKHLAIRSGPMWSAGSDKQTLLYTSQKCPSPIVEKAIKQIIGWMNDEIDKVHTARLETPPGDDTPELNLPSEAVVEIKQREGGYLYHDMEFRLDRNAVVELLMGESLYGGPELALRELVQNALDAVHLRDQRNRLAEKLETDGGREKMRQPHQPWGGQKAEVNVTWGEEEVGGKVRRFVRVEDSGVGMTVGTMRRFLTQIGKSYYKSDDFLAEQELMRRHGILCTAISQFGIGFLSVFMLADEVTIHTRPVGVTSDKPPANLTEQETARFPFRAEIHGPHGLLTFYPDPSITLAGTAVTIWLKDTFVLPKWNRDFLISQLRAEFYERAYDDSSKSEAARRQDSLSPSQRVLDPAFEIGRFIVWPLYPVRLSDLSSKESVEINDSFHHTELLPLDRAALKRKAEEWGHAIPEIDQTDWQVCDWTDEHPTANGVEGTGSRIRLIGPQPEEPSNGKAFTPAEWAALSEYLRSGQPRLLLGTFTEPQLRRPMSRYQCLVNGVRIVPGFVPNPVERDCKLPLVLNHVPLLPGAGGWVWIDLRGAAMPRLRADRSGPTATQPDSASLTKLSDRWKMAWKLDIHNWLPIQVFCRHLCSPKPGHQYQTHRLGVERISPQLMSKLLLCEAAILQSIDRALPEDLRASVHSLILNFDLNLELEHALVRASVRDLVFALALPRVLDRARTGVLDRDRDRALASALDRELNPHPASALNRKLKASRRAERETLFTSLVESHLAWEGLGECLANSHPAFGLSPIAARLHELRFMGPLHVTVESTEDTAEDWLEPFDLIAPFTGVPLAELRNKSPQWAVERHLRVVYMLPFLFGSEPHSSWRQRLERDRPFDLLLLFLPNPDHYEWLFHEHSREEWAQGSASALWDLKTGKVLYADGIHDEASLRQHGEPLRKWLDVPDE